MFFRKLWPPAYAAQAAETTAGPAEHAKPAAGGYGPLFRTMFRQLYPWMFSSGSVPPEAPGYKGQGIRWWYTKKRRNKIVREAIKPQQPRLILEDYVLRGKSAEDIAKRFGMEGEEVRKILAAADTYRFGGNIVYRGEEFGKYTKKESPIGSGWPQ